MRRLEFDSDPTMTGRVLIADHEVPDVFGSEPLLGDYPAAVTTAERLNEGQRMGGEVRLHIFLTPGRVESGLKGGDVVIAH
jgi:hypothetical protein